jgi:hypothetical protein
MKKYFFLTLVLFVLTNSTVNALISLPIDTIFFTKKKQETLKDKIINAPIVIKTSPTAFLGGGFFLYNSEYRLMVEITTGRRQSEQAAISFLGKGVLLKLAEKAANYKSNEILKITGWKVQYAHKFYLITKRRYAPSGFFVAPMFSYYNTHISIGLDRFYHHSYFEFSNLNADIMIGVQAAHAKRLTFEAYCGAGYKSNLFFYHATSYSGGKIDTTDFPFIYTTHLNLLCGINLGWAF